MRSMALLRRSARSRQGTETEGTPSKLGLGNHPMHGHPPADWREPLDDLEEEKNDGVQGLHIGGLDKAHTGSDVLKRTLQDGLSVARKKIEKGSDELWTDWPVLGKGWKRRVYSFNSGTREDTYYMSPDGVRLRSKVELGKHLPNTDLSCFQYKTGLFLETTTIKSNGVNNTENGVTLGGTTSSTPTGKSGRSQSVTQSEGANTSTSKLEAPQSISQSYVTTPPQPHPKPATDHPKPSSNFGSPPRLAPISPLVHQSEKSPSLHLGDLSPAPSPGKLHSSVLSAQAWLHPALKPLSPIRSTRHKGHPTPPNDHTPANVKVPPRFPSPPVLQRVMDAKRLPAAKKPSGVNPVIRDCASCGCMIAAVDNEELCVSCITLQKLTLPKRNIVFKKVGQGQWVLANPIIQNPEQKAKTTEHEKIFSSRSQKPLNVKTNPTVHQQDSDAEEEYEAKATYTKKRQRRMCFKCEACLRQDCGRCDHCKDKPKFGGRNTKKQKCRLRFCIYEQQKGKVPPLKMSKKKEPFEQHVKPTRPRSKRPHKRPAWEEDYTDPEEEEKKKRRQRHRDVEAGDDEDEDYHFELEQDDDDDKEMTNEYISAKVDTEEPSLHSFPFVLQNGGLQMNSSYLQTNVSQGPVVWCSFVSPPAGGGVVLSKDAQMLGVNMNAPMEEDSLDFPPTISQMFSLADASEPLEGSVEAELHDLLDGLRCTVLPAHWVAVLAKGPALQLLQCSRRSPMADTLLQIEPGFRFGLSVQGLPLPPRHPLYERHPPRLTSVSQVVELLLDLEGLEVCQGYPWGSVLAVRPRTDEAVLCIRATACHLLVDPEEEGERCDRCHPPPSDA